MSSEGCGVVAAVERPVVRRAYGLVLVFLGTVLWSSAGLFARAIDVDAWAMQGWRAFFGGLSLTIFIAFSAGRRTPEVFLAVGRIGAVAVPLAAVSMLCYVAALKLTTVANVLVVYATLPFVVAGVAWLWMGERLDRRVGIASLVALAGVVFMAAGSLRPQDFAGNAASLVMTVTFAILVVMIRRHPGLGMAPVNALGAFLCAAVCLPFASALPSAGELFLLALFGLTTTSLAYMLFLTGSRHIPAAEAGIIALLDVVLGPTWVYLAFGEDPGTPAVIGGAVVLAALAWYLLGARRVRPLPVAEE